MSKRFLLGLLLSFGVLILHAQDLDQLKKDRVKTLQDIEYTNKLLAETGSEKKASLNQLSLLRKKIKQQEKLIQSIQQEISILEEDTRNKEAQIQTLRDETKQLKEEYAQIIRSMYKNKHDYDTWLFVFSAGDFNQAYKRLKYLEQYSEYRKRQVQLIEVKDSLIQLEIDSLLTIRIQKEASLRELNEEKIQLDSNRKQVNKVVSSLKTREKELKKELKRKEVAAEQIRNTIEKILAAEREKAKKAKMAFALTPEEQLLSDDFSNNRGNFPWPTEKGIITAPYGEQPHPVLRGIKINNTGVDISTEAGSAVRSIFAGEVRDVWSIKGKNMAIIIKHGEFFTVYQNLVDVKVKTGDKVNTKQVIGRVYTDEKEEDSAVIHLEIWRGSSRENPELWLAR